MTSGLFEITTNTRYRFKLDNDPTLIAPLVDRVQQGMIGMQLCSPAQRMHIGIALEEALINAMYHGNLELPSHRLRQVRQLLHEGKPSELVDERRMQPPYKDRAIQVAVDFTRNRAQFVVSDEGEGFDVQANLPAPDHRAIEGAEGGRGLLSDPDLHGRSCLQSARQRDANDVERPAADHRGIVHLARPSLRVVAIASEVARQSSPHSSASTLART